MIMLTTIYIYIYICVWVRSADLPILTSRIGCKHTHTLICYSALDWARIACNDGIQYFLLCTIIKLKKLQTV